MRCMFYTTKHINPPKTLEPLWDNGGRMALMLELWDNGAMAYCVVLLQH